MFFFRFFPQEITKLKKYYTLFSFAKVDDQPVALASVIHLMSEKRARGIAFSNSLLMAIHVQVWGSRNHPTTNHKINTSTIQLLKQRLKDRKCSLDFKTFL